LQKRNENNPVHPLTFCFFSIFQSYFPVKILGACPVSHISSTLQTLVVLFYFIAKILFRKDLPPVLFVLLARQQLKLHHPSLQYLQITHHYPTKTLVSQPGDRPWRTHTTNAPKQDVLLAVYFGPQRQIEISVSNCSCAKRSIYVPT
jgi:hypothetical protein